MPLKVPTPGEVRRQFQEILEELSNGRPPTSLDEFSRVESSQMTPTWVALGSGIEVLQVDGSVRLVKLIFTKLIENHGERQHIETLMAIRVLAQTIRKAIPAGSGVAFVFGSDPEKEESFGKRVTCWAKGIVRN